MNGEGVKKKVTKKYKQHKKAIPAVSENAAAAAAAAGYGLHLTSFGKAV